MLSMAPTAYVYRASSRVFTRTSSITQLVVGPAARTACSLCLCCFFFSSRRRHTISVSAFLLNRSSDLYYTLSIVRCLDLLDCNQHCYSLFLGLLLSDERKMLVSTSIVLKFTVFLGLGLPPFWDRGEGFYLLGSGNRGKTVDFLRFEPIANSD